ncbi:MAG: hypothetical protein NTX06_10000 [Proteobacteria bacterium]|nr:hypothetical protein [Pseudomonadota bacterium]
MYACVSDSYDIWNAISNIWGRALKESGAAHCPRAEGLRKSPPTA